VPTTISTNTNSSCTFATTMNSRTNATTAMPKEVHFGAGNIGRGFIAPLLAASGYSVVFAARDPAVVDALNTSRGYDVHVLDERAHSFAVGGVSAVPSTGDAILNALADPTTHVLTTAVGPSALAAIAPTIARGLVCRREMGGDVLNVIACEVSRALLDLHIPLY
jgi:mannitol-1-phosphate 5-dehydrogenase